MRGTRRMPRALVGASSLAAAAVTNAQHVRAVPAPPDALIVNGRDVQPLLVAPPTDASTMVYDNISGGPAVLAPAALSPAALDDVILSQPGRQRIQAARFSFRVRSGISAAHPLLVQVVWYDSFVPVPPATDPPLLGPLGSGVNLSIPAPPGGWRTDVVYDTGWFANGSQPSLIDTLSERGLFAIRGVSDSIGGPVGPAIDAVFTDGPVSVGVSGEPYWVGVGGGLGPARIGAAGPSSFRLALMATSDGLPTCWANCDFSTTAPVLNALDFTCFLSLYRRTAQMPQPGQVLSHANCDGSTSAPALNALDLVCFLSRYRMPEPGANCP